MLFPKDYPKTYQEDAPLKHSSIHMAVQTPANPMEGASSQASERRTAQMLKKFIRQGAMVLPIPMNTLQATIDTANIGYAKASIRRALTPSRSTSGSCVMVPIMNGAPRYITTPITPITAMPTRTVMRAN